MSERRRPPRTLIDLLRRRAGDDPERPLYRFLIDGEEEGPRLACGELAAARAIAALYELGGDPLLATQVLSRLRRSLGVEVDLEELLEES